jgi:hypothetical protein
MDQVLRVEVEEAEKTRWQVAAFAKRAREEEQQRLWREEDEEGALGAVGNGKRRRPGGAAGVKQPSWRPKKAGLTSGVMARRTRKGSVLGAAAGVAAAAPVEFTGPLEAYGAADVRVRVADLVGIVQCSLSEQRGQRAFCRADGATKVSAVPEYAGDF